MSRSRRPGRSTFQLLLDRQLGSFVLGKTLAFTGVWIHNVVAVVLAWELTQSAIFVALVSVVQFVPQIVLAPIVGPMADRSNRGQLVAFGRIFCLFGSGGLAVAIAILGSKSVGVSTVLVATFILGIGFAVSGPAMQAMVSDLVEPDEVGRAVSLDSMATMLGRAFGPAIGALLAAYVGPVAALSVAALGHLVFAIIAAMLSRTSVKEVETAGDGGRFRDGLLYVRSQPVVTLLLFGVTAVGIGADPVVTLAPAIAEDLGGGQALVGYLGSAFGIGAVLGGVLGTFIVGGSRYMFAPSIGLLVLGLGLSVVPAMQTQMTASLAFFVAGIGFPIALAGCTSMLHQVVPTSMRGRVMSLWLVAFLGSRPIASALDGILADLFGVDAALILLSLMVVAAAAICSPMVLKRSIRG